MEDGREGEGTRRWLRRPGYLSYLIRIWQPNSGAQSGWIASAEAAGSHEKHSFGDLSSLYAFLDAQTHADTPDAGDEEEEEI